MNLSLTLRYLRPGEEWTLDGDDYTGLTWLSDTPIPTETEIAAAWPAAQAAAGQAAVEREQQRAALLERLGLTADEFAVLVGGIA